MILLKEEIMKLIIIDHRMPREAKEKLSFYGRLLELSTAGITYDSISGHPDIFFCQAGDRLFTAPNTPRHILEELSSTGISFKTGEEPVGDKYPATARYNAVVTDKYIIHNFRYTDLSIVNNMENRDLVHMNQGYCRCNVLPLKDDHFITSDEGIFKVLRQHGLDTLLVSTEGILLEGQDHGFFGGACGIDGDHIFITGSLDQYADGQIVSQYLQKFGYRIVPLFNGPLMDCGSILIVAHPGEGEV
jgi:hypothetical protein